MKKQTTTNKGQRAVGLYNLALERIEKCEKSKKKVIPFPVIFQSLCRSFSITKKHCWEILFILRDFDMIQIVPYHGVRLR